jgi:hypothetical protein
MNNKLENSQWVDLVSELFDRLTGKGAIVEYNFDNFTINIPKSTGPNNTDLVSAKWILNGKLIIKGETHKADHN